MNEDEELNKRVEEVLQLLRRLSQLGRRKET